jgi:YafQ family addiction module toxin component
MYKIKVREKTEKIIKKVYKKDKTTAKYISNKIKQIQENPYAFKPLKKPLQGYWRVHIGNFVMLYSINEKTKTVIIEKYAHHDKAYK